MTGTFATLALTLAAGCPVPSAAQVVRVPVRAQAPLGRAGVSPAVTGMPAAALTGALKPGLAPGAGRLPALAELSRSLPSPRAPAAGITPPAPALSASLGRRHAVELKAPIRRALGEAQARAGRPGDRREDHLAARERLGGLFDNSASPKDGGATVFAEPILSTREESKAWTLMHGGPLLGRHKTPEGVVYGGRRYADLMNATAKRVSTRDGKTRDLIWVRGVRSGYKTRVREDGSLEVSGYDSDVLLFELREGKPPRFIERTLESGRGTLIEDPRVSSFNIRVNDPKTGKFRVEERAYLGFTVHKKHGGMAQSTSRNGFVRLLPDKRGIPRIARDAKGEPAVFYLSPEPLKLPGDGDGYATVDAKNGLLMTNARGRLRLHSRHRYRKDDPRLPRGFEPANYAEQSFPLPARYEKTGADWNSLMRAAARHETLRAEQLPEHYPKSALKPGAGKGMGPGAQPVRIQRRGARLFVSEGWGRPWVDAGPLAERARNLLKNRRTLFLSFDHDIRFLLVQGRTKRVYTLSAKLWDQDLDKVLAYAPDLVQPKEIYETQNPGIPDLWHVYPTGRIVREDGSVDTFEGAADAGVVRRRWNLPRLLNEF